MDGCLEEFSPEILVSESNRNDLPARAQRIHLNALHFRISVRSNRHEVSGNLGTTSAIRLRESR
jgi:hypothetical protein